MAMPFTFTAAHSSRIRKPRQKKVTAFDRQSGRLSRFSKTKSSPRSRSDNAQDEEEDESFEGRLDDKGLIKTLATDLSLRNVVPTIRYIRSNMFDEMPQERSGMSSTHTAEVLTFRKYIPPIVTTAHIHALINSPTSVEKEISKLVKAGLIKRITVPGRGSGASSISNGLVLVDDWAKVASGMRDLPDLVKGKYIDYLKSNRQSTLELRQSLAEDEITSLMRAGLLITSSFRLGFSPTVLSSQGSRVSGTLTSVNSVSRAASGSVDAVGGRGAVLESGGGGSSGLAESSSQLYRGTELDASLPNTGALLKLIEGARSHMVHLLSKSKYKEAPVYLLRERWNGSFNTRKQHGRSEGPFSVILPGQTRKWREYYGLSFDWVLAECLGGGLIEVFETGSVGFGARLT